MSYAGWWHDRSGAPGAALALDARPRTRSDHGGRVLEVLDHDRFGRLVALDGALVHVEEDAVWREMLVHVVLGAVPHGGTGGRPHPETGHLRVLVLGGDPAIAAEALLRPDVAAVEVDIEAADAGLFAAWADAVGLDVAAHARLRIAAPGAASDGFDVAIVALPVQAAPPATAGGEARAADAVPRAGVVVTGDAVILEKHGPRWLGGAGQAPAGLAPAGRWFATSPIAPGGFYGFTAFTAPGRALDLAAPVRAFAGTHYNAELHRAAFALPAFFRDLP